MLVINGAVYHLAPTVIVFPLLGAFKMPFAVQLQYDLILPLERSSCYCVDSLELDPSPFVCLPAWLHDT